ncbi:MAG: hypothetical protein LBQ27_02550 [Clostridiales bacterium]|jgi:protein arginine kinase|nr:hypothetical protein [Clostridiales bacterium]
MSDINKIIRNTAVSSRVRLARNIEGYVFPAKLKNAADAERIISDTINCIGELKGYKFYKMSNMKSAAKEALAERMLISGALITSPYGAALTDGDEKISVMFHEEDHIRQQCILSFLSLKEAYLKLKKIDDEICVKLNIAKDKQFGYLTACPSNLGAGLRASVMLFLPALTAAKKMKSVTEYLMSRGLTVRGVYGEGSGFDGYMCQISNRSSFRKEAEDIIGAVESAALDVIIFEHEERQRAINNDEYGIIDETHRAYGLLTNAVRMSYGEALELLSRLKFGVVSGITNLENPSILDTLITIIKPSSLVNSAGRELDSEERDLYRAHIMRENLKEIRLKIKTPTVRF